MKSRAAMAESGRTLVKGRLASIDTERELSSVPGQIIQHLEEVIGNNRFLKAANESGGSGSRFMRFILFHLVGHDGDCLERTDLQQIGKKAAGIVVRKLQR